MANDFDTGFGVEVPGHTILSRLGRGGMATVFLARDEQLNRLVAVKVIGERFDEDVQFKRRFEREARVAAGLTHPNIVPVHTYGYTSDKRPYISMTFLDGGTLRDRLRKRGALPVDEALGITRQMASALLAAHARNIVHRDLKPDNVLFQGDTAFLTDFGIAKLLDATTELTRPGSNPGTVKYFSPEQALEQAVDQRSDIYALGVVLYEMLTGRIPIEADTMMQFLMRISHVAPAALPADLKGLQPFMDVLLAKDPAERVATCADVVSIIQAMERNWMRFGAVDRLTDGVEITPSGQARASVDMDATQMLDPAIPPATDRGAPDGPLRGGSDPQVRTGPTFSIADRPDLGRATAATTGVAVPVPPVGRAPAGPAGMSPAGTLPAGTSPADDDSGLTDMGESSAVEAVAQTPAQQSAEVEATDATIGMVPEPRPPVPRPASRLAMLQGVAIVVLAVLVTALGFLLWWRGQSADGQRPDVRPPGRAEVAAKHVPPATLAPAVRDGAPVTPASSVPPVSSSQGSAPVVVPPGRTPVGATPGDAVVQDQAARPSLQVQPLQLPVGPTPADGGVAVLTLITTPAADRVTLVGTKLRYKAGIAVPAGTVRVRVEKNGYLPREEQLDLRPGPNHIEWALTARAALPAPVPAAVAPAKAVPSVRLTQEQIQAIARSLAAESIDIPAGAFRMGDVAGGGERDEQPPHDVSVGAFRLARHEVTVAQYEAFAQATGRDMPSDSGLGRDNHPVVNVSSSDANAFAAWLSEQTHRRFRLPTEAEWEYAARAGGRSRYAWGETIGRNNANCAGCGSAWDNRSTAPVGSFAPNHFGLYDMHGNVWEWVLDCYNDSYVDAPADGGVWTKGDCSKRVLRGGAWDSPPAKVRAANRDGLASTFRFKDNGFRLAEDP